MSTELPALSRMRQIVGSLRASAHELSETADAARLLGADAERVASMRALAADMLDTANAMERDGAS